MKCYLFSKGDTVELKPAHAMFITLEIVFLQDEGWITDMGLRLGPLYLPIPLNSLN